MAVESRCGGQRHFRETALASYRQEYIQQNDSEQVSVQLPTSAVNVALPAFSAARRAAVPCCCGAGRAAIDRYLLPAGPTAANPPHAAAADELYRQTTDTVPLHVDLAAYYASSVDNGRHRATANRLFIANESVPKIIRNGAVKLFS